MTDYIRQFFKTVKDNLYVIIHGDYKQGDIDLNTLGNLALMRLDRKTVTPPPEKYPSLTPEQKKQLKEFYKPYIRFVTDRYHRIYTDSSGEFHPEYIPEELFFMHIDRYFSSREEARFLDNKCYYCRLFSNVKQAEPVVMRIGKSWLDASLRLITAKEALSLISEEPEVVLKRAVNSEGGKGVFFIDNKDGGIADKFKSAMRGIHCDVVVQRPIKQHPALAALHPESVNSMRVVSLLTKNEVKIYAVCVKIGTGKSRQDNAWSGGIYCSVGQDSRLGKNGVLMDGSIIQRHPQLGYRFEDMEIPHLDRALALVREAHSFMGHFRLISWDVTIDEKSEALLIESNMSLGVANEIQITSGPLFGGDTKKILDEVFKGRRRLFTTLF